MRIVKIPFNWEVEFELLPRNPKDKIDKKLYYPLSLSEDEVIERSKKYINDYFIT